MRIQDLQMLIGNPKAYALQQEDGAYLPVREPLTPAVLQKHLGGQTVGTYVVWDDQARTLVFDIDNDEAGNTLDQATSIRRTLIDSYKVPSDCIGIEFSGKKGHHVWVIIKNLVPARDLRRLGQAVSALAGFKGEVFPKQDRVEDLGNLVKLPGGIHRVTGHRNLYVQHFVPVRGMTVPEWVRTTDLLPPEVAGRSTSEPRHELDRYPCMEACMDLGVQEGSRNIELLQLAVMLRRGGVTDEYVRSILESVNEKGDPVTDRELDSILRQSAKTGPICDQVPENRQCGELCVKARGLKPWPGRVLRAAEGEGVVLTLEGRTEAGTAIFSHPDTVEVRGRLR